MREAGEEMEGRGWGERGIEGRKRERQGREAGGGLELGEVDGNACEDGLQDMFERGDRGSRGGEGDGGADGRGGKVARQGRSAMGTRTRMACWLLPTP